MFGLLDEKVFLVYKFERRKSTLRLRISKYNQNTHKCCTVIYLFFYITFYRMGEYPRGDHYANMASNLASITRTVDCMKSAHGHWAECFRIVDTVLTKVVQVQQLHMDLMWDLCKFSS